MAKSSAQRQAEMRARIKERNARLADTSVNLNIDDHNKSLARLNVYISARAKAALLRMAKKNNVTQKTMIEALIVDYEARQTAGMDLSKLLKYFDHS